MQKLMRVSQLNEAERPGQSRFSLGELAGAALAALAVVAAHFGWAESADRTPLPPRSVAVRFEPLALDPAGVAPLRLVGAWRLSADDPRFGGLSALAVDGGGLVALSDSGVVVRLPLPGAGTRMAIGDLPGGPGSPDLKQNRDSEALARDPLGRGWWVAFERHNQLWLYDRGFRRALGVIDLGRRRWPDNRGIEAMLAERGRLTLVPELARELVKVGNGQAASAPIADAGSMISDAAQLPGGELLVLLRDVGPGGFRTALGLLVRAGGGWRLARRVPLHVGRLANLEGLAVEPRPGGTRLWLVTDDNFQPPQTTLLLALDLPPGNWPGTKP